MHVARQAVRKHAAWDGIAVQAAQREQMGLVIGFQPYTLVSLSGSKLERTTSLLDLKPLHMLQRMHVLQVLCDMRGQQRPSRGGVRRQL